MPHRMVGILSLLLVFALEMRAQGEVVLSIDGEPVKRSEFEYYFRKSSHRTPLSFLPSFINYKLKVRYAHDMGIDTCLFPQAGGLVSGQTFKNLFGRCRKGGTGCPPIIPAR